jgi:rubredoxin
MNFLDPNDKKFFYGDTVGSLDKKTIEFEVVERDKEQEILDYGYDPENPPKHTGLFFRGYNHVFYSNGKFEQKKGYRLLKRKSCKGCPTCDFIFEELLPTEAQDSEELDDIKDGQLYMLSIIDDGGTYEYPNDIDYWVEFKEVEE